MEPHIHKGKSSEALLDKIHILKELNITPGNVILDAGCGNGYMTKEFARILKSSGKIYALDPDKDAIGKLKEETKGSIVEAIIGDITHKTIILDLSIDLIYISLVIHGFSSTQMCSFISEVKRILKPSGKLAILEIVKENTPFGPPMEIRFSPEELMNKINLHPTKTVKINPCFYIQFFEKKNI